MKDKTLPLSVAIITKDEEEMLPDCLKTVSFADDIVVVDSGSRDRTVEIATEFGCRVFVEDWKGYGPQKNSAVQKCKHDWVLIIDADERIPVEAELKIKEVLKNPLADAFSLSRKNFFHGKWIRHSGFWPDRTLRLVKKTMGNFDSVVHEKWATGGRIQGLDAHIEHYSFSNYSDMLKKLDEYSSAAAGMLFDSGIRTTALSPLIHACNMFFKTYIIKRGFLDGFDGLIISLTKAGGSFFKYAKLLELQKGMHL